MIATSAPGVNSLYELIVFRCDNGQVLRRYSRPGRDIHVTGWMPDSRSVAVTAFSTAGGGEVSIIDVATNAPEREVYSAATTDGAIFGSSVIEMGGTPWAMCERRTEQDHMSSDIITLSLDDSRQVRPLITGSGAQYGARVSPDGRWLAYSDEREGTKRVVLVRMAEALASKGDVTRISTWTIPAVPADTPRWSADGKKLFVQSYMPRRVLAVDFAVNDQNVPVLSEPKPVTQIPILTMMSSCEPTPDGRLMFLQTSEDEVRVGRFEFVQGWLATAKEKLDQN
jgi:Tol biopolymer transport system component